MLISGDGASARMTSPWTVGNLLPYTPARELNQDGPRRGLTQRRKGAKRRRLGALEKRVRNCSGYCSPGLLRVSCGKSLASPFRTEHAWTHKNGTLRRGCSRSPCG